MKGFLIPSLVSQPEAPTLRTPASYISLGYEKGQSLHWTTMGEKLKTGFLLAPASVFK